MRNKPLSTKRIKIQKSKVEIKKEMIEFKVEAYSILGALLDNIILTTFELHAKGENGLAFKNRRTIEPMGENKPSSQESFIISIKERDYIVGMTDNHIKYLEHQLSKMWALTWQ